MQWKHLKVDINKNINYYTFKNKDFNKQSLRSMLEDTMIAYETGFIQGEKNLINLIRLTQQTNLQEKQIEREIERGYIDKGTIQESIKRLRKELLKKAVDGKYITVIDKNGIKRQYTAKYYAELVARTKLAYVNTTGTINTLRQVGGDLVQVSVHNTNCAVCVEYEGKIYSVSGNDKNFPKLDNFPPYHPNYLHSISVTFEEGLEADGTLQEYIDFSKGLIDVHPTRKSWIKPSDREYI